LSQHLRLVHPHIRLYDAFVEMSNDYCRAGETRYQHEDSWNSERFERYLQQLADQGRGVGLPSGKTPIKSYWLLDQSERIAGVSRLRPILNDELLNEGGNIGYDVPPSQRMKGYGTELLRQTLLKAREHGLQRALVTFNKDNIGSRKIIESNGGTFASEGISIKYGKPLLRFWIVLVIP
jgi:predicted acetyltransferase